MQPVRSTAGLVTTLQVAFTARYPLQAFDSIQVQFPEVLGPSDTEQQQHGFQFPTGLMEDAFSAVVPETTVSLGPYSVFGDQANLQIVVQKLGGATLPTGASVEYRVSGVRLPSVAGETAPVTLVVRNSDGATADTFECDSGVVVTPAQNPAFTQASYSATFAETDVYVYTDAPDAVAVVEVLTVRVEGDPNTPTDLQFSIIADDSGGKFAIDVSNGRITATALIDFDGAGQPHTYNLTVRAASAALPHVASQAAVAVHITDVNDNRPTFAIPNDEPDYGVVIHEETRAGRSILRVAVSDADAGQNGEVTLALSGTEARLFDLTAASELALRQPLLRASTPFVLLSLQASDSPAIAAEVMTATTSVAINVLSDKVLAIAKVIAPSVNAFDVAGFENKMRGALGCAADGCTVAVWKIAVSPSGSVGGRRRREVSLDVTYYVTRTNRPAEQFTFFSGTESASMTNAPATQQRLAASNPGFTFQSAAAVSEGPDDADGGDAGGTAVTTVAAGGDLSTSSDTATYYGLGLDGLIMLTIGCCIACVLLAAILWVCCGQRDRDAGRLRTVPAPQRYSDPSWVGMQNTRYGMPSDINLDYPLPNSPSAWQASTHYHPAQQHQQQQHLQYPAQQLYQSPAAWQPDQGTMPHDGSYLNIDGGGGGSGGRRRSMDGLDDWDHTINALQILHEGDRAHLGQRYSNPLNQSYNPATPYPTIDPVTGERFLFYPKSGQRDRF